MATKRSRLKSSYIDYDNPPVCHICGRNGNGDPLDRHHVFPAALRSKSEKYGAVVYLCHDRCHENGPEAVHRCYDTELALKQEFQRKLMAENEWTVEDFIREFGRNYL